VTEVSAHTGFPRDARRPRQDAASKIHGGLLRARDDPAHLAAIKKAASRRLTCWSSTSIPFQAPSSDTGPSLSSAITF